ncbi:MAG: Na+/H+ antiporter subunit E [Pseudorhodoplanes sp.]
MRRWIPSPVIAALLLALWLLLNQTLAPGQIILGCLFAMAGSWLAALVETPKDRIGRPISILRLWMRVLADIVRSNIAVARIILGLAPRPNSGFVRIPLDLNSRAGLAVLACIITATPGTVWVDFDAANRMLTIHVLDFVEESDWINTIKHRYESLLLEIFV